MITFSTDSFQIQKDFSYEKPKSLSKLQTNPRYRTFRQIHFTAGDEDQFMEFWESKSVQVFPSEPNLNERIMIHENILFPKYSHLCMEDVLHTYRYISDKFKKGIFFQIGDQTLLTGRPHVFLPFSKSDFQNEWSEKIKINPRSFKTMEDMVRYTHEIENREFFPSKIHKNQKAWYGNNGLVRFEFPISEGDSGVNTLKDMFRTLIYERIVPPLEGFINKRDFPLLKKDGTESYDSFFGIRTRLLSHSYSKYAPVLSMTTTPYHADIPIPTWEDWAMVSYWYDQRLFGKEYREYPSIEELQSISWDSKKPTAVFRGASTGQGTTLLNNIRLQWSAESFLQKKDKDGIPFLDVGITKWNLRPRKHPDSPYLETILVHQMSFPLVSPLSPLEQAHYKYILHLPGHSAAYRLSLEMFMGSVILYYPCMYYIWFFPWMKPWVHFVPLTGTTEDLYAKIRWCKANDDQCRRMAEQAKQFAHQYLTREAILDYLQKTLWSLFRTTGTISHLSSNGLSRNDQLYRQCHADLQYSLQELCLFQTNYTMKYKEAIQIECFRKYKDWSFTILRKEGKNTCIYQCVEIPTLCQKKSKYTWKREHQFHAFCSYSVLNSFHSICPFFVPTYWDYALDDGCHALLMDYHSGSTLESWIQQDSFQFEDLMSIFMYLSLILQKAQDHCEFIHMDLYPWNIMIQTHESPFGFSFEFPNKKFFRIQSSFQPILLDYGKSHFLWNGQFYYNSIPFLFCRFQDILSIVFSSLYCYLEHHKIGNEYLTWIFKLLSFFSTEYTDFAKPTNLYQVKAFLKRFKKYSVMLSKPKKGLEHRIPLDFFEFLWKEQFPHRLSILSNVRESSSPFYFIPSNCWNAKDSFFIQWKHSWLMVHEMAHVQESTETKLSIRQLWLKCEDLLLRAHKYKYPFHMYVVRLLFQLLNSMVQTKPFIWDHIPFDELCVLANTLLGSCSPPPRLTFFSHPYRTLFLQSSLPMTLSHLCHHSFKDMDWTVLSIQDIKEEMYQLSIHQLYQWYCLETKDDRDYFYVLAKILTFYHLFHLSSVKDSNLPSDKR